MLPLAHLQASLVGAAAHSRRLTCPLPHTPQPRPRPSPRDAAAIKAHSRRQRCWQLVGSVSVGRGEKRFTG